MDDEKIIALFLERNEQGIAELQGRYGRLCHSIAYNILYDNEDAEECVNDSYLAVWNTVPPQHPNPLTAFLCRIVRNLSIARYRRNNAKKRSCYAVSLEEIESMIASGNMAEQRFEIHQLTEIIAEFLDGLSAENRVIFMRRYWFCDSCNDISQRVGISEKAVTVRLTRIRAKLRDRLLERGTEL